MRLSRQTAGSNALWKKQDGLCKMLRSWQGFAHFTLVGSSNGDDKLGNQVMKSLL